jgi:VanZ family protein
VTDPAGRSAGRALWLWLWLWLPVLAWASVIFAFSATANLRFAQASDVDFVVRKAGHMFVFGVLALLFLRALQASGIRPAMAWSLLFTVAYAVTDELHQAFTQGRHPSPVDVGIDAAGALIALTALALLLRARRPRQS